MTQRPTHVPKFGNWDANDHVPFTAVFENARARKGGSKMINPNDPSENSADFSVESEASPPFQAEEGDPPAWAPRNDFQEQFSEETSPNREHQDDDDSCDYSPLEQLAGLPVRKDTPGSYTPGNVGREVRPTAADGFRQGSPAGGVRDYNGTELRAGESPVADPSPNHPAAYQGRLGNRLGESPVADPSPNHPAVYQGRLGNRESPVADPSPNHPAAYQGRLGNRWGESPVADSSPNHPAAYQGRLGNRAGSAYSAWDRKAPTEGGPMSSGKFRLRPGVPRADETPDRSPVLPRFGAWDEKDPASGEGFTVIFNQARSEKKAGGPVRIPPLQAESPARLDYSDALKKPYHSARTFAPQKKMIPSWACCFQTSTVE